MSRLKSGAGRCVTVLDTVETVISNVKAAVAHRSLLGQAEWFFLLTVNWLTQTLNLKY